MNQNNTLEAISDFCEAHGYSFHEDYSGRGMYGQSCIGISFRNASGFQIGVELALHLMEHCEDDAPNLLEELTRQYREDQLGLGSIIYFPGISAEAHKG